MELSSFLLLRALSLFYHVVFNSTSGISGLCQTVSEVWELRSITPPPHEGYPVICSIKWNKLLSLAQSEVSKAIRLQGTVPIHDSKPDF